MSIFTAASADPQSPFVSNGQGSAALDQAPLYPVVVSFGLGIELLGGEVIPFPNRRERRSMSIEEFLAGVVPPGNYVVICDKGQTGGMAAQFFPRDRVADAGSLIRRKVKQNRDVWFALASYREANPHPTKPGQFKGERKQTNAQNLRCFWLDADISRPGDGKAPGKAFADEAEFETWLTAFCDATGLPYPNIIVNSGYGRHCYWILEDALSREEWEPLAEAFKAALLAHGAKGDVSITSDAARILRLPGTFNFKVPNDPKPVEVIHADPEIPNALMCEKLKPYLGVTPPRAGSNYNSGDNVVPFIPGTPPALAYGRQSTLNAAAQAGVEQQSHSFARISAQCEQVKKSLAVNGKGDSEPLWWGFIQLASFCDDGEEFAHEISKGDPRYSEAETKAKLEREQRR